MSNLPPSRTPDHAPASQPHRRAIRRTLVSAFNSALAVTLLFALALTLMPHASAASTTGTADAARTARPSPSIQGMWVWQSKWYVDPDQRRALLAFCETHGYNLLMVQVHLTGPRDQPVFEYPDEYRALVIEAARRDIAVEVLDGEKNMAMRKNWPRTLWILDRVLEFNAALPEDAKLAGIHYDIEPYIMDAWKNDPAARRQIMLDLLAYYDQAKARIEASQQDLTLAADIPFWYDNKVAPDDHCIVTYRGQTKNLHEHIQDICDYIGIMSYRRHAVGHNSVTAVVENELAYAEKIGKFVTPALETIQLDEAPTISFFGLSADRYWQTHRQVEQTLADRPGFGGMLSHCYRGLRDLLGPVAAK